MSTPGYIFVTNQGWFYNLRGILNFFTKFVRVKSGRPLYMCVCRKIILVLMIRVCIYIYAYNCRLITSISIHRLMYAMVCISQKFLQDGKNNGLREYSNISGGICGSPHANEQDLHYKQFVGAVWDDDLVTENSNFSSPWFSRPQPVIFFSQNWQKLQTPTNIMWTWRSKIGEIRNLPMHLCTRY